MSALASTILLVAVIGMAALALSKHSQHGQPVSKIRAVQILQGF